MRDGRGRCSSRLPDPYVLLGKPDPELVAGGYGDIAYELDALDRVVDTRTNRPNTTTTLDDANNIVSVDKTDTKRTARSYGVHHG